MEGRREGGKEGRSDGGKEGKNNIFPYFPHCSLCKTFNTYGDSSHNQVF